MKLTMEQYGEQIYVNGEKREAMLHAEIHGPMDVTVQVGPTSRVEIDKLYGPLVFWPIRVWLDIDSCEWVIEREMGSGGWREVARIPGQMAEDYAEDETAEDPA